MSVSETSSGLKSTNAERDGNDTEADVIPFKLFSFFSILAEHAEHAIPITGMVLFIILSPYNSYKISSKRPIASTAAFILSGLTKLLSYETFTVLFAKSTSAVSTPAISFIAFSTLALQCSQRIPFTVNNLFSII
jgi:hypothetical protein